MAVTLEAEDVDDFALGRIHVRQDGARERFLGAGRRGIEERDLANVREQVHHLDDAEGDASRLERLDEGVEDAEGPAEALRRDPEVQTGIDAPGSSGVLAS